METVAFITTASGDDLIVPFAILARHDPTDTTSLILVRTPQYEFIFDDDERGVRVSPDSESDDEYLREVRRDAAAGTVLLKTTARRYSLDVGRVHPKELESMRKVLHLMNFDGRMQFTVV